MKLKLIATFLLLATLLTAFAGCGAGIADAGAQKEDNPAEIVTGETSALASAPSKRLMLAENGASKFQIVYPISSGTALQTFAEKIATAIEDATGVKIPVVHDSKPEKDYEIRIGRISRYDAMSLYSKYQRDFGARDFVVEQYNDGKTIHMYALNLTAVKASVTYFLENMLYTDAIEKIAFVEDDFAPKLYIEPDTPIVEFKEADEHYLYFTANKGTLAEFEARLSFTGNKAWRLQTKTAYQKEFNDIGASQRLSLSLSEEPVLTLEPIDVTVDGKTVTATEAGGSRVVLTTDPFKLVFYTPTDKVASTITNLTTSTGGSSIEGDIQPNEAIFGTGERFDSVNQRGKEINMFTKDIWSQSNACYMVIPLLCFSRGSGVFLNIYEEINLSLGSKTKIDQNDVWTAEIVGNTVDSYFYTSEQMSDAIYGYSVLSGFAEMPEEWSYGMIICRYSNDLTKKWGVEINTGELGEGREMGVYDCIAMMEAYDLPWTGILAEAWGPDNQGKQDDLKELCDYVHSLGKKFLVYMRVGYVSSQQIGYSSSYAVSMTKPDGTTTTMLPAAESNNPDTGGATDAAYPYLDVTNPEAVSWFFGEYWDYLSNDIGVDGCKIDFCETVPEYYELNYYDENQPTSGSHHWLPTAFCAMFWDMISSKPDSGMCYSRGGGIGSQRAPYMWAGDQFRHYNALEWQLTACLSSGMSGVPFMSYDMSGYQYGNASQDPYYEGQVFVRGLQFTAFTICMQQHGKVRNAFEFAYGDVKKEYVNGDWVKVTKKDASGKPIFATDANGNKIQAKDEFGNLKFDAKTGEPIWEYVYEYEILPGSMTYITDIYRGYLKLHELLTPYITEYSEIACTTGMPVMRLLALIWQDDVNVYDIDDEYMFGDAFLVAPVLNNKFTRDIYLPEGNWKDLNTGRVYNVGADGMKLTNYAASLAQLPVFYNLDNTSEIAADLLPGIQEVFDYLNAIDTSSHIVR